VKAHPCGIVSAINQAPAHSNVVIEPGTYGSTAAPITTTLQGVSNGLNVHGEAGKAMPLIVSTASGGGIWVVNSSLLSDLRISWSSDAGGSALVVASGAASHVIAIAAGINSAGCGVDTSLSDSECIDTADAGVGAYGPVTNVDETATLRGDTVEATGMNSVGAELISPGGSYGVIATNSIFHGEFSDVFEGNSVGGSASDAITLSHCDYATVKTDSGANESVTADSTNIATPPAFVNPIVEDFNEAAGSATINKGEFDPPTETDVLGHPRTLGSAPDIGAFEFLQKPVTGTPKVAKKTSNSATLSVRVNPEGLPTVVHLVAIRSGHTLSAASRAAGKGTVGRLLRLTIGRLAKHARYEVFVYAKNAAGHVVSRKVTVTTTA
jgi:hypothetical protein